MFDQPIRLTKRLFVGALSCPKAAYFDAHKTVTPAPPSKGSQALMQMGVRVGEFARGLYPEGRLVAPTPGEFDGPEITGSLIRTGAKVLFEAVFQTDEHLIKADIMRLGPDGWEIIEVKSSTRVKKEAVQDLAFQVYVARISGLPVTRAKMAVINKEYVYPGGEIDPCALFAISDETAAVEKLQKEIDGQASVFSKLFSLKEPPPVQTNRHCNGCGYYDGCHADQRDDDLVFLSGLKAARIVELRSEGFVGIRDLDENTKLNDLQHRIRSVVQQGVPHIDPKLSSLLQLKYPAHFIDFEAFSSAFPRYPGIRPYQVLPFQWSNHIIEAPGSEPRHEEFLHREDTDPREDFARTLLDSIRNAATIVVYSPYESTQVANLEKVDIPGGGELQSALKEKQLDLLPLIRDNVYFEAFKGSFSIKVVLPTLVEDCGYGDLVIQGGDVAAIEYQRMLSQDPDDAQEIATNLLAYCERDTLAMVRIHSRLIELCKSA